jgi:hypothetical protein
MHFSRLPWILNKLASMREQCTATECCCVFFSLLLPLLFCFVLGLIMLLYLSLLSHSCSCSSSHSFSLLAVFSSFVTQKLLLSQTRRRTRTWNHLGSSSSRAGESTYVTYSFGNHFGGGHVYHAPGASYPGRSLAKGVPGRATIRHNPPTKQEPKPAPKQNKKKNPLREQLASKQVQKV